eukprot:5176053-Amphidinium_carterae.2
MQQPQWISVRWGRANHIMPQMQALGELGHAKGKGNQRGRRRPKTKGKQISGLSSIAGWSVEPTTRVKIGVDSGATGWNSDYRIHLAESRNKDLVRLVVNTNGGANQMKVKVAPVQKPPLA